MSSAERQRRWRAKYPEAHRENQRRLCEQRKRHRLELKRLRIEVAQLKDRLALLELLIRTRPLTGFGPLRSPRRIPN